MLFNSWTFLIFLSVVFFAYYLKIFRKVQVSILIIASLFFYSFEDPKLLLLLLSSAFINTYLSYIITYGSVTHKKFIATAGVSLNLLILCFFKYGVLLSEMVSQVSPWEFVLKLPLPIGISFFTFEGISLLIDVYSEKYHKREESVPASFKDHIKNTLFFISFFPHLVSGPILKAHEFLPQIKTKRFADIEWEFAIKKIVVGYFLKIVIADNLNDFTWYLGRTFFVGKSTITLITLLWGYSIQIFADFAGYSLIAIGLAALFGYRFPENFNFPYIATSFSEFWKRWHISLSSFLREYLYIPLGGNRRGAIRTHANLMATMVLGGLWHGSSLRFAAWGFFHGTLLVVERMINYKWRSNHLFIKKVFTGVIVFNLVSISWIFFKLTEINFVIEYFRQIINNVYVENDTGLIINITLYSLPVILYHLNYLLARNMSFYYPTLRKFEYVYYGFLVWMIVLNTGPSNSFIYFQF